MTSVDEHKKKIKEHLEEIDDAVDSGIENKPVTIGFHCSSCALQFLEIYLHAINKIPVGKIIKHDWFKRPQPEQKIELLIERKLSVVFPKKQEIYSLIYDIEEERTSLLYGNPDDKQIKKVLDSFLKLKDIFEVWLKNEKIEI